MVGIIDKLDSMSHNFDVEGIWQLLLDTPTGFNPSESNHDLLWVELVDAQREQSDKVVNMPWNS